MMRFRMMALPLACAAVLPAQELAPGDGKDVVERVCAPCHGLYNLVRRPRTRAAWEQTVENMRGMGAKGSDADFRMVVDYLARAYGVSLPDKVNLNKAGYRLLTSFFALFPEEAEAIVKYREENGPFRALEDLKKVPRLEYRKVEAKKDRVEF